MTKEELEKEANKYADDYATPDLDCSFRAYMFEANKEGYLAGAEPREKRIAELEAMLHGWAKKCADLESTKEELVKSNQTIRSKLRTLKNDYEEYETAHIALVEKYRDLEKENAELKERVDNLYNSDCWASEQLTKAKELLKKLLSAYTSYADSFDDRDNEIVAEAEQFLSEVK